MLKNKQIFVYSVFFFIIAYAIFYTYTQSYVLSSVLCVVFWLLLFSFIYLRKLLSE